jgi:hypothetical protein
MRPILWTASLLCLLAAAPVRADEAGDLLDRAVKAQGGDERLSKAQGITCRTKGHLQLQNVAFDLDGEATAQGTGLFRWKVSFSVMGRTNDALLVVTPEKIWNSNANRPANELPAEFAFLREVFRTIRLAQNLHVLRDKDVTISHLGELKVDERICVGLKVVRKGWPDVDLCFDKETLLPARAEVRVKEPGDAEETVYGFHFSNFKDVDGVKLFAKVVLKRDDKTSLEMEFSDLRLQDKFDDNTFAKP